MKELKLKCEERRKKQKNEKEPKEEKIYFELSNVYLANNAKNLENWDFKKTQISNRSESIVMPGVFSEKTIKKLGKHTKLANLYLGSKAFVLLKKV